MVPFVHHRARALIFDQQREVGAVELYDAYWFDTSFATRYAIRSWPQENVLLLRTGQVPESCNELVVSNRSQERLGFVAVQAGDVMIAIGVNPDAVVRLPLSSYLLGSERIAIDASARAGTDSANVRATKTLPLDKRATYTVQVHRRVILIGVDPSSISDAKVCR